MVRDEKRPKALVSALAERYAQGVSTHKVKAIPVDLCGPQLLGHPDQPDHRDGTRP